MKIFLLVLFSLPLGLLAQTPAQDLEKLFRKNPGLITQANPEILRAQAARLLDQPTADRIYTFMKGDLTQVTAVRTQVINLVRINPTKNLRRVIVSGQSVSGLMAAAVAAQSGHQVDVYDVRGDYDRAIQWSSRQSVPDALAAIDQDLAVRYTQEVAKDLSLGSYAVEQDGRVTPGVPPGHMVTPDPRRVPQDVYQMLDEGVNSNVQTRIFERLLADFLSKHPNVRQHKGKIELGPRDPVTGEHSVTEFEDVTPAGQVEKVYRKISPRTPGNPFVVIAEGAGSTTRAKLGIRSIPASLPRLQTAGVVHLENGGSIATLYRAEGPGKLITSSIGVTGSKERWFATDVDETKITPARSFGVDPKNPLYVQERARLLELEFKRIAELNLQLPNGALRNAKVSGAVESRPLQTFVLEQHISSSATSGNNVLLAGDAVGNGHWKVGGGMHVSVVQHPQEFKAFLTDVDGGGSLEMALQKYDAGVLRDSTAWVRNGLHNFYDNITPEVARAAFDEAGKLFREGKVESYQRALELQFPEGRKATTIRKVRLNCAEIPLRILGDL